MVHGIFDAKSIAVIGASREAHKVGHAIFKNLLLSKKRVYPINPKARKILGVKAYPSVLNVKEKIDLAVIAVPAQIVPKIIEDCAKKEIKNVIIISAGFSEVGNNELEKELLNIAKKNGIRILGPNCLGVIDTWQNLNTTFFSKMPSKGKIAFVSQSGALGVAVLDLAIKKKIGLSKFISVGNMADIDWAEIINYLNKDKNTKVICLYIESVKKGKDFIKAAKKAKKPIIALKAGQTSSGIKAAASHTGALATESAIYSGVFKQCKISEVSTLFQLFEIAQAYAFNECPAKQRALIITNAGGPGVIAADAFEKNGIQIVKLPKGIIKKLNKILPQHWSHSNPIDIIGDATPERYEKVLNVIKNEKFYNFVFLILTPQTMTEPNKVAEIFVNFHKKTKKPCFGCFMGGQSIEKAKNILSNNNILNFEEPEYGAIVISRIRKV